MNRGETLDAWKMCATDVHFSERPFLVLALSLPAEARLETAPAYSSASARMPADRQTEYSDLAVRWTQHHLSLDATH
jgi:hypothetical protein